jgi:hypothetical protein
LHGKYPEKAGREFQTPVFTTVKETCFIKTLEKGGILKELYVFSLTIVKRGCLKSPVFFFKVDFSENYKNRKSCKYSTP